MDGRRDTIGFGDDLTERRVVGPAPGIQGGNRPDGRRVEGADGAPPLLGRERGGERLERWRGLEPVDDEEQVRPPGQLAGEGSVARASSGPPASRSSTTVSNGRSSFAGGTGGSSMRSARPPWT